MLWRIQQEEQKDKPDSAENRAMEDAITKVQMNVAALIRENGKLRDIQKQKSDGSLIGGFAEFERKIINERTKGGRIATARENKYAGGGVPFGSIGY